MRAVGYIRISRRGKVGGLSIVSQERDIERYCQKQGLELIRCFRDEGESGRSMEARLGVNELLHYIAEEENEIKAVVVRSHDRLSRNIRDFQAIEACLEKGGIRLISTTQKLVHNAS